MRTPEQEQVLRGLGILLDLAPDLRVGQLVGNLGFLSEAFGGRGMWDIEDDEMLQIIERHRNDLERRHADVAESA